ncbi:hypothetical protein [Lysobacter sp. TAB13]|uniref:hypothetical protein n=1 Tax=Lysobacter sp. TAB13 TaxID=3233065 RepID=UPI003F97AD03
MQGGFFVGRCGDARGVLSLQVARVYRRARNHSQGKVRFVVGAGKTKPADMKSRGFVICLDLEIIRINKALVTVATGSEIGDVSAPSGPGFLRLPWPRRNPGSGGFRSALRSTQAGGGADIVLPDEAGPPLPRPG